MESQSSRKKHFIRRARQVKRIKPKYAYKYDIIDNRKYINIEIEISREYKQYALSLLYVTDHNDTQYECIDFQQWNKSSSFSGFDIKELEESERIIENVLNKVLSSDIIYRSNKYSTSIARYHYEIDTSDCIWIIRYEWSGGNSLKYIEIWGDMFSEYEKLKQWIIDKKFREQDQFIEDDILNSISGIAKEKIPNILASVLSFMPRPLLGIIFEYFC